MQSYFDQIETLCDIGDVLRYTCGVCVEWGAVRLSYHITPAYAEPTSATTAVYAEGFSQEWLELYIRHGFRECDPIPARVLRFGAMMTWADAMDAAPNTPDNERYFEAMRNHGLVHGFGLPLFGPRGRDAYAGFDFDKPVAEVDGAAISTIRAVSQFAHQRICWITDQVDSKPVLSHREIEVLTWMARGKTTQTIATILDLSPDTVKTYSKRIYAKLDVTDRVGAVLKGLRLGVVLI